MSDQTNKILTQGKVKWFHEKDGYGFITNTDNVDHYFTVRNIIGADLPKNGQPVEFVAEEGKKGPIASDITLLKHDKTESNSSSKHKHDRVICGNCEKKIVPRIHFRDGEPHYSVCPFCAHKIRQFSMSLFEIISTLLARKGSRAKVIFGVVIIIIAFIALTS